MEAAYDEGESLSWAYSLDTILDEISQPAVVFREGQFEERPPLSEEEYFLFAQPIGYAKTHLSLYSEVATIPTSLADKGIQECAFKITFFGYSEAALRKLQFLAELGFAEKDEIEVDGVHVAPRSVLSTLLKRSPQAQQASQSQGFKDIATLVKGRREDQPVSLRLDSWAWPHLEWGFSGGKRMVASPPAIAARWLADGRVDRPGVWAPEQIIDGQPFFEQLALRGIHTKLTQTESIAGANG